MAFFLKKLNTEQRNYLIYQQALKPAAINLTLNGSIGWLTMRKYDDLAIYGENGVVTDLSLTGFLLPFLTCIIISPILAGKVKTEELLAISPEIFGKSNWYSRPVLARAGYLGLLGLLFAALPAILVLQYVITPPFSVWSFVFFKGLWAGVFAGIVTPLIASWALVGISNSNKIN